MRKIFGVLLLLLGIGAYLYYVQGWDWARWKRTQVVSAILRLDQSATTTPIGSRGTGTHWETAAPMPQTRTDFGAVTIGDTIYVVGGVDGFLRSLNSAEAYDIASDKWREIAPLPMPVHHPAVTTDGTKLYLLGGFTGLAARPLDSAYVYDPKTNFWTELGHLNDFRGGAAAADLKDRLYVMAGQTSAGIDGVLEYYDPDRSGWNGLKQMLTPRAELQAVAVNGKIYAMGGSQDGPSKSVANVEAYDPTIDEWKPVATMSVPRVDFAAATDGSFIYAIGGQNKDGIVDTVEAYDLKKGTWSTMSTPMPDPRHGLAAAAWKNRIYVLGGGRRNGLSVTDLTSVLIIGQAATPAPAPVKK